MTTMIKILKTIELWNEKPKLNKTEIITKADAEAWTALGVVPRAALAVSF